MHAADLSEAISKLNAGNRVDAFRLARDAGWLWGWRVTLLRS
jgi:hypothetical protein